MKTITIAGDVSSALTHFALCGLSSIARNRGAGRVLISWTEEPNPKAQLHVENLSIEDLAQTIISTAEKWANSWTREQVTYGEGTFSPFSPRFKAIDTEKFPQDWQRHQRARTFWLDRLTNADDHLALDFIDSLGEAAYWRFANGDPRPDHGASRWEMRARNRGNEFISAIFHPMCQDLAHWKVSTVVSGLLGETINDTLGKNDASSRTPTGLTRPGPTDVALAFVGLLGISRFPLIHRMRKISVTPGAYPNDALHPTLAVLPVNTAPMTPERYENLVASAAWAGVTEQFGLNQSGQSLDPLLYESCRSEAARLGAVAAAVFVVHKGGSKAAPERNFEIGRLSLL